MKINFDGQTIEYDIAFSSEQAGVLMTNITFPHPLSLKNETRMDALREAVLHEHKKIIELLAMKVAKDGEVTNDVKCIYKEAVNFDSFDDRKLAKNSSVFFKNLAVDRGTIKLGNTTLVIGRPKP